jgi:anti-sigma regulatory factor (Ser/Thr protein kinase)
LSVWLGGLPDCYLLRTDGSLEILESNHLPIGVLSSKQFDVSTMEYQMNIGDRFYLWSDGIHEARNEHDEMYGEERLLSLFKNNSILDELFDLVKDDVTAHVQNSTRDDDITMLEIEMVPQDAIHTEKFELEMGAVSGPTDWSMTYRLGPATLRDFNPLPLLLHLLMEVPGLRQHSGTLYTVLAELFSNALEHGVIGLNSNLKADPTGFGEYYTRRQEALVELHDGFVNFSFEHIPTKQGGLLRMNVEDSGAGFEYSNESHESELKEENFHGRGIPLIKSLCRDFRYKGSGNEVEAIFEWRREA